MYVVIAALRLLPDSIFSISSILSLAWTFEILMIQFSLQFSAHIKCKRFSSVRFFSPFARRKINICFSCINELWRLKIKKAFVCSKKKARKFRSRKSSSKLKACVCTLWKEIAFASNFLLFIAFHQTNFPGSSRYWTSIVWKQPENRVKLLKMRAHTQFSVSQEGRQENK